VTLCACDFFLNHVHYASMPTYLYFGCDLFPVFILRRDPRKNQAHTNSLQRSESQYEQEQHDSIRRFLQPQQKLHEKSERQRAAPISARSSRRRGEDEVHKKELLVTEAAAQRLTIQHAMRTSVR